MDFFVSYARSDLGWAEWIAWELEEAGYRVLLQAWDVPSGSNWVASLQKGVRDATRTIAVLSAAYDSSVYGAAEWQAAWVADPSGAARKLLVFRVEDCSQPGLLRSLVSVDLFGITAAAAREVVLRAAAASVSGGRVKPNEPPPFPGGPMVPPPPVTRRVQVNTAVDGAAIIAVQDGTLNVYGPRPSPGHPGQDRGGGSE